MSRIKILLLILIIAALSIVFVQNREPISLQFLCADRTQNCLYQTPPLPLAVWIALATLTGAIANLLVQSLNLYGYSDARRQSSILDEDLYPSNKQGRQNGNDRQNKSIKADNLSTSFDSLSDTKNYEVRQEPQNVEKSGSTYSYKYREAYPKDNYPKNQSDNNQKKSSSDEVDFNRRSEPESNDEDWI